MLEFFRASCEIELQLTPQGKERFQRLHATFPSPYVQGQTAFALFHLRQYDEASRLYEELRQSYPFRLEGLDNYSNILYVTEERAMLSVLAQYAVEVDKYRPETCFIVGNYYSIKADHTRAIMYFQRALRLEPKYSGSWTLIGHEYLEMRAGESAINAYRYERRTHQAHKHTRWQLLTLFDPSKQKRYRHQSQRLASVVRHGPSVRAAADASVRLVLLSTSCHHSVRGCVCDPTPPMVLTTLCADLTSHECG